MAFAGFSGVDFNRHGAADVTPCDRDDKAAYRVVVAGPHAAAIHPHAAVSRYAGQLYAVSAALGLTSVAAFGRSHRQAYRTIPQAVRQRGRGEVAPLVVCGLPVVFVKAIGVFVALPSGIAAHHEGVERRRRHARPVGLHGQGPAALDKHGRVLERRGDGVGRTAGVALAGEEAVPVATVREIHGNVHREIRALSRFRDGSTENQVAEEELARVVVGGFDVGLLDVETAVEWQHVGMALPHTAINIRHQARAQMIDAPHGPLLPFAPQPGATVELVVADGVNAQGGVEQTELRPARVELGVGAVVESADVMCPEKTAGVAAGRREVDLEAQYVPVAHRVARELDGMAVVAPSAPAGEALSAQAVASRVVVVELIEPGDVASRRAAHGGVKVVLLPVLPPESHADGVAPAVGVLQEGAHVATVAGVENGYTGARRVDTEVADEGVEHVLMRADAIVRMVVEGDVNLFVAEILNQARGVGDELAVPAVAGPAAREGVSRARSGVLAVPVHVEYKHIHGEVVLFVAAHNVAVVIRRIGPPAAIPRAEHVFTRQGGASAYGSERTQCRLEIRAVDKEIEVLYVRAVASAQPPVAVDVTPAVVYQVPTVAAQQSVHAWHRSAYGVQRHDGAEQIAALRVRQAPAAPLSALGPRHSQVVLSERSAVGVQCQLHGRRREDVFPSLPLEVDVDFARRAVDGEKCGVVQKFCPVGILQPDEVFRDESQAAVAHDERLVRRPDSPCRSQQQAQRPDQA